MMRNQHLIPANVIDLVERINNERTTQSERMHLLQRLEVIREYTENEYAKIKKKYL